MDQADPDVSAIKTEPGLTTGSYDESESLYFNAKIKTENEASNLFIKEELTYPDLCIEFEPDVERGLQNAIRLKDSTETKVKVERHTIFNQHTPSVKLEPGSSDVIGDEGVSVEVPCIDTDISIPHIKQECLESRKTDRRKEVFLRKQDSSFDSTAPQTGPGRALEVIILPTKEASGNHVDTPTEQKQFSCPHCAYVCHKEGLLKRHKLIHTRGKLYSCSLCTYTCNHKGDLRSHVLTHTGEKPFSCSNCAYTCNRKSRLRTHMLTHTGEKPFSCSQCTYTCSQRGHLRIHMLTHTGEKPFSCPQCSYTCSQNSHLRRHMVIHTGEKSISCSHCSYKCSAKGSLKRHMFTHIRKNPRSNVNSELIHDI